jgi:hypothetical protein
MPTLRIAQVGWSTGLKLVTSERVEFQLLASSGEIRDKREPVYATMSDVGNLPGRTNSGSSPSRFWEDPSTFTNNEPTNTPRMKIIMADGNVSREISIGFNCDNVTLPGMLDWIFQKRKDRFKAVIGLNDLRYVNISDCTWNQFSLNGSANGLVTGSLSAQTTSVGTLEELMWSGTDQFEDLSVRNQPPYATDYSTGLVPYWQTGNQDVTSWSINVSQALTPVYLNNGSDGPMYFRVGNWDITVTFETLVNPQDPQDSVAARDVRLCAQRLFRPLTGMRLEKVTTRGGNEEPVKYSFTFGLHAEPTGYADTATSNNTFEIDTA